MIKSTIILGLLVLSSYAVIREHLVTQVPGYSNDYQYHVYSGYLNTSDPSRRLHYVFVESIKNANNDDPVTLWLNGGPGCSSLLGYLQEIGPFYLEEGKNYTVGDKLTPNPFSWNLVSNLLFLQSPAGVGYSLNTDASYVHNDLNTARDNFEALKFFFTYYPEYRKNAFWIAGESYAGKYIPDLAMRIDFYNLNRDTPADQKINMKGVFIGNGVIDFTDDSLFKSTVEYFLNHDFLDPETYAYWENACQHDEQSAGCQFFYSRMEETLEDVNPYNIYSECYYNDSFAYDGSQKRQFLSQQTILRRLSRSKNVQNSGSNGQGSKFNGAPCAYFDGLYQYFNAHWQTYNAKERKDQKLKWNGPCADDINEKYKISMSGSTHEFEYLITRLDDYNLVLYNGDWDGVVPFVDTYKNLQRLKVTDPNLFAPIIYKDQHIGYNLILSGMHFIQIKGASHQVPQSKRQESLYIFTALLNSSAGKPLVFN